MNSRLENLRARLQERDLDALLISTPENRHYLSGFTGSAGYLLISQTQAILYTDFRYVEQASHEAPDFRVERIGSGMSWLAKLAAADEKVKRVGFESQHMTVSIYKTLTEASQEAPQDGRSNLVATSGIVEAMRAIKDPEELYLLTKTVRIADLAYEEVVPTIHSGMTEAEVAWRLEKAMREKGANAVSFDIIVGSGPNGALPHHRAGDRVITEGDPVVIDMGAKYQGYCSDMSRTIVVGEPDEAFRKVYDTVLGAQLAAEATVTAGMTGGQVDSLARRIIEDAGYGDKFGHSLGHGIGLAVHELPRVGPNADGVLEDGMVFTIEPGIYISGWGGVRIEDMVVLEGGKARILTTAHKKDRVRK